MRERAVWTNLLHETASLVDPSFSCSQAQQHDTNPAYCVAVHVFYCCSCWSAWRLRALQQSRAAAKISSFRSASDRKLGSAVLREWARLSWLLPREQRADAFAATWLLKRSLLGWRSWLVQKRKWELLGDSLAARWTNLHLTTAWQAWRAWVQGRQEKARLEHTVARRWNNLHLAAAFQAWVELVQVRAQICLSLNDNFSVRHRSATDQTRKVLPSC